MSNVVDDILQIVRACQLKDGERRRNDDETVTNDSVEKIGNDAVDLLGNVRCNMSSIEYASLNKMLALNYLKTGKELKAICCLIESHAVILRQHIVHRYLKTRKRESVLNIPQTYGLKSSYVKFKADDVNDTDRLKSKLSELPEECAKSVSSSMHAVHIAVLLTGKDDLDPFCVTLPKPKSHTSYDVCREIKKILSNNRSELEATYVNNELYWKMRERQNRNMKAAIKALEHTWLREWRVLFMADPMNNDESVADLLKMIDKLVADYKSSHKIGRRAKWLLKKIALGSGYLTREEIARAVKYVLPDHERLAGNVILSIYGKSSCTQELRNVRRKTLVLVVDEHMDYVPFESMEILRSHPVTRFPSLHIAYALFKEHERSMEKGCRIIKAKSDMGTCIVNPSGNLTKMERRMKLFIKHWLPDWKSWYNVEPKEDIFEDALVNHDILMYNGHGSGIQYLPGEQIERLKVKSIVLLFGCSSVKLLTVGGRYPPYGVSNQYLIAASPCVLGMLWEVTDADIDKMTANFISSWIPSPSSRPWSDVDINAWCTGTLKFLKSQSNFAQSEPLEPEMLRAVAKSKEVCSQYMTAAAIVARGLPVKLV